MNFFLTLLTLKAYLNFDHFRNFDEFVAVVYMRNPKSLVRNERFFCKKYELFLLLNILMVM